MTTSALTTDEQLRSFLEQWEATHAALVKKYTLRAEEDLVKYGEHTPEEWAKYHYGKDWKEHVTEFTTNG